VPPSTVPYYIRCQSPMKVLPLVFTLILGWAAVRAMDTIAQIETTNPTPSLQAQQ